MRNLILLLFCSVFSLAVVANEKSIQFEIQKIRKIEHANSKVNVRAIAVGITSAEDLVVEFPKEGDCTKRIEQHLVKNRNLSVIKSIIKICGVRKSDLHFVANGCRIDTNLIANIEKVPAALKPEDAPIIDICPKK